MGDKPTTIPNTTPITINMPNEMLDRIRSECLSPGEAIETGLLDLIWIGVLEFAKKTAGSQK